MTVIVTSLIHLFHYNYLKLFTRIHLILTIGSWVSLLKYLFHYKFPFFRQLSNISNNAGLTMRNFKENTIIVL